MSKNKQRKSNNDNNAIVESAPVVEVVAESATTELADTVIVSAKEMQRIANEVKEAQAELIEKSLAEQVAELKAQLEEMKKVKVKTVSTGARSADKMPVVIASTELEKVDEFGNRADKPSRSAAINAVLIARRDDDSIAEADKGVTVAQLTQLAQQSELGKAYEEANGKPLGAVQRHLDFLFERGFVFRQNMKWRAFTRAEREAMKAKANATQG